MSGSTGSSILITILAFCVRFYWFINMGGLLAFSGVSYIQQEVGFSSGFLIPLISMSLALPIFLSARRRYIHLQVQGSVSFQEYLYNNCMLKGHYNCIGCTPPNQIPYTTIVAFGAITDTWNVSVYIHIMNTNTTAPHL